MPSLSKKGNVALSSVPASVGIGLKAQHYRDVLDTRPALGFFEVHTENYMGAGGAPHRYLEAIREIYPLSFHGVGLSLGSAEGISQDHLAQTRALIERYQPGLVSEHLSFSVVDATFLNDLIPLPMTSETLKIVSENVSRSQDVLGRKILVENPSSYLQYSASSIPEAEFLAELSQRTGCGLLLDVNNVHVSALNHGFDPIAYLDTIPAHRVGEVHLAGHHVSDYNGETVLIDDHGAPIVKAVWDLYAYALARTGPVPSLIERDTNIPPLTDLLSEAAIAAHYLGKARTASRNRRRHADAA